MLGHFDFRSIWKWSSRAPKIKFLQYVNSRGLKKFSRIAMSLIFFQRKLTIWTLQICKIWSPKWSPGATISYWLKKVQVQFYLNFEGIFGSRTWGSKKGSIYVCRNLPMSHLIQSKTWKWGFGWYSNLQAPKTWIFQISSLAHKVWWILGAPIWAPKSPKFYFHKL